jgi:pyruvate formate lyase activating enzyme
LILENLDRTSGLGKPIWVRIPLIPGVNDSREHVKNLVEYVRGLNVERTFFLPYHEIGVPKYEALNREYNYSGENHSLDRLKEIKEQASEVLDNVVVMGIE